MLWFKTLDTVPGFFGALRTACSIVMDHSVLGRIGLGCSLERHEGNEIREVILPQDGLSVRFYHVPDRWKAEVQGGYIREIKVMDKRIAIETVSLCTEGTHLTISSIPQEGEKQKVLFEKDLYMMEEEFCVTQIPMSW